jgi:hypothetical protein
MDTDNTDQIVTDKTRTYSDQTGHGTNGNTGSPGLTTNLGNAGNLGSLGNVGNSGNPDNGHERDGKEVQAGREPAAL